MKINKILSSILTVCLVSTSFLSMVQVTAKATEEQDGLKIEQSSTITKSAIKKKQYTIHSESDFYSFMTSPLLQTTDYEIILACDIDMDGEIFKPIEEFSGKFNGCGHVIKNLIIQDSYNSSKRCEEIALVKTLDSFSEIKNVTFDNYTVENIFSEKKGFYKAAGFVVTNYGNISGVNIIDGQMNNTNIAYTAGFVLNNEEDGLIKNCSAEISSEKSEINSGFVYKNSGKIKDSYTKSSVNSEINDAAGFVLNNEENGIIENCSARISSKKSKINAGFVYKNSGEITNSYTTMSVDSEDNAGGFVNKNFGTIKNCKSSGNVKGFSCVGGFVANNYETGIISDDCVSTGNATGRKYVGAFCGDNKGAILGSSSEGDATASTITVTMICGGFVGLNSKDIIGCTAKGAGISSARTAGAAKAKAGGFVGENYGGSITFCTATKGAMATSFSGNVVAGGFVGENSKGEIKGCIVQTTGEVYSKSSLSQAKAGGFVGINKASIESSRANGEIYVSSGIFYKDYGCGGFVGKNDKGGIIKNNCVARCTVETRKKNMGGGFVGEAKNNSAIYDSMCKTKRVISEKGETKKADFCYKKDKKAVTERCYDDMW